jgi:hypothetical protein
MTPDQWQEIRTKFEQGISQRTLATKYDVSQSAISQKAKKDQWVITPLIIPQNLITPDKSPADETSDMALIEKALAQLATFLNNGLADLRDHKLFADALSQYIKLKLISPSDKKTESGLAADMLPYFDTDQLHQWSELEEQQDAILEAVQARKLETEQGIKSIRKKG